jgi:hypothetical protein
MVSKDDISLAIEYVFQNCKQETYPSKAGLHYIPTGMIRKTTDECECIKSHLNAFKKHPKDFVMMTKKKMARVI